MSLIFLCPLLEKSVGINLNTRCNTEIMEREGYTHGLFSIWFYIIANALMIAPLGALFDFRVAVFV